MKYKSYDLRLPIGDSQLTFSRGAESWLADNVPIMFSLVSIQMLSTITDPIHFNKNIFVYLNNEYIGSYRYIKPKPGFKYYDILIITDDALVAGPLPLTMTLETRDSDGNAIQVPESIYLQIKLTSI